MLPIIYLHGFASGPGGYKARYFKDHLNALGFDVHIPDLNGPDFFHMTLTSQIDILRKTRDALPEGPVILMGSSMGCVVAGHYALGHPPVDRMVLMAPAFGFVDRWLAEMGDKGWRRWQEEGKKAVFHFAYQEERFLGPQIVEDYRKYDPSDLDRLDMPIFIVHGRYDDIVPCSGSRRFAEGKSNVQLTLVEDDHHLIKKLDQFTAGITAFLTQ